jgi:multidrug transporter EmrE-like cation transporter
MNASAPSSSRLQLALLWLGLVAADTAAQLLFKAGALRVEPPRVELGWLAMVAQSPWIWAAASCLLLTFGLWMLVLRRARLSTAFPVTALTFVGVIAGSRLVFQEAIAPQQYAGIALIVLGVALLRPLEQAPENRP